MAKFIKWIFIVIIGFALFKVVFTNNNEPVKNEELDLYLENLKKDANRKLEQRFNEATQDQKNCVNTLGQGVYKDKSLEWKLDNCNVPRN